MAQLQTVRGTYDVLPDDYRLMRYIEQMAFSTAEVFGFAPVSTPIFEFSNVFHRTLGDTSDIVTKETYTFTDRGGEEITLRPEGTAAIVRAFLSNKLTRQLPLKWCYFGPFFRHERPQKGRQRQFHSFGVEHIGDGSPFADAEVIELGWQLAHLLGIKSLIQIEINTLGDVSSRNQYRKNLIEFLEPFQNDLSIDSQQRLHKNPLRILDSKDPKDQKIIENAPKLENHLNKESKLFFDSTLNQLNILNIPFQINSKLVRGLDYYSHTVFEFTTPHLGSQSAILAGGRYDGLVEQMGGPTTPAVGWGAGIERWMLLMDKSPLKTQRPFVLIPLGEKAQEQALLIAQQMRKHQNPIEIIRSGNLKKRLDKANRINAHFALIFGDEELKENKISIKNLDSGEQKLMEFKSEEFQKIINDYIVTVAK